MSDTDDTDVLVLIPHDFFTVSSSEDERLEVGSSSRPLHRRFYSPGMSQERTKPSTLPSTLPSSSESRLPRPAGLSSFRSPARAEYNPAKVFSPSKSEDHGSVPRAAGDSRLRHSTSDLPTLNDVPREAPPANQRQRSYTGDLGPRPGDLGPRPSDSAGGQVAPCCREGSPHTYFRNPEQPAYDTAAAAAAQGENKREDPPKEDKTSQPYLGEKSDLPYVCGDNIGSIPDLGFGLREFLASLKPSHPQSAPTPKEPVHEEPCVKRYFSSLGGETALSGSRRQLNFDEQESPATHGPVGDGRSDGSNFGSVKRPSAFVPVGSSDSFPRVIGDRQPASLPTDLTLARSPSAALPSLAQLWREERPPEDSEQHGGVSATLLHQRLEEEQYRRLHCERLIADLQQKLLRESERVAVATQLDARKDEGLARLRERYDSAARHWHVERERLRLELAEKSDTCSATVQRLRGCERELSKALDLASGFQQRAVELERQGAEAEGELRARVTSLERQGARLEQENLKLRAAAELHQQHQGRRDQQLAGLQNVLEDVETENKRMARELEERAALEAQVRELEQRSAGLEQERGSLQLALEAARTKERGAREEARELRETLERSRGALKSQYQAQLEQVVRAKLAEFQAQLDSAEAALRTQWENRELEERRRHKKALMEAEQRHLGELRQLEEHHKREIAWWKRSLAQGMHQAQELTSELERQEQHREQLAGKLRSMLHSQYQQASTLFWDSKEANGVPEGDAGQSAAEFKGWASLPAMGQGSAPPTRSVGVSSSEAQLGSAQQARQQQQEYSSEQLKKCIERLLHMPQSDPILQDSCEGQSQGMSSKNSSSFIPELDLSRLRIQDSSKPKSAKENQNKPPWK